MLSGNTISAAFNNPREWRERKDEEKKMRLTTVYIFHHHFRSLSKSLLNVEKIAQ